MKLVVFLTVGIVSVTACSKDDPKATDTSVTVANYAVNDKTETDLCPGEMKNCQFAGGTALHHSNGVIYMIGHTTVFADGLLSSQGGLLYGCNRDDTICTAYVGRAEVAADDVRDLWMAYSRSDDAYTLWQDAAPPDHVWAASDENVLALSITALPPKP